MNPKDRKNMKAAKKASPTQTGAVYCLRFKLAKTSTRVTTKNPKEVANKTTVAPNRVTPDIQK